ncbi:class I SAM-dependent methyltransferase [Streptomyces sp. NPDC018031]|uniref:class I SAM-dependent methyltransferase n=1 Tax=Streptomyces sp. NPDC018031 TaxID=3365033 RepID=UPI003790886C
MHRPGPPDDRRDPDRAQWDTRVPPGPFEPRRRGPAHPAGNPDDPGDPHVPGDPREPCAPEAFRRGEDGLHDFERAEVGDVTGRTLLHLQCHTGVGTLSWVRHGAAQVVGLDVSEPAVEAARDLAADLGLGPDRASFVAADVHDAAEAVPDSRYDIVYMGAGGLGRLPDLRRWAETAAHLVAPGGFLYLAEFHPVTDVLDDESGARIVHDYFSREPWVDESPGPDTDLDAVTAGSRDHRWQHPLGDVVSAVAGAGLRVEFLHEHDVTLFQRFACLWHGGDGYYRLPPDRPRVPLMYSLKATRP